MVVKPDPHTPGQNVPSLAKKGSPHQAAKTLRIAYVHLPHSKVKSKLGTDTREGPNALPDYTTYWLDETPDSLKVSGGSKKH